MIHVQTNSAIHSYVLVYSDLTDAALAQEEVAGWAREFGYRADASPRRLSVFKGGSVAREWTILERDPAHAAHAAPRRSFKMLWRRAARELQPVVVNSPSAR